MTLIVGARYVRMGKRGVAAASAIVSVIIALGVGFGVASATEKPAPPGGGTCNNYGNGAVVVAPFCGANLAPAPAPTTTRPELPTRPTTCANFRDCLPPITNLPSPPSTTRSGTFPGQPTLISAPESRR